MNAPDAGGEVIKQNVEFIFNDCLATCTKASAVRDGAERPLFAMGCAPLEAIAFYKVCIRGLYFFGVPLPKNWV
ncbi:hypothetical protein Cylst_3238 [Cylindrospermum stagnale PCC 7417]|uniref:Uncharacterized protein n=1 Tax=Cylindrospermum stagnale PCC 7417 TaxID=56107 RepID=K9X019_9NOST|nr:hypothetical protein Cylst_3238 [Cylindrospermum stagnale PCC 7417]